MNPPTARRLVAGVLLLLFPMAAQDRADRVLLEAEQARQAGVPTLLAAVKGGVRSQMFEQSGARCVRKAGYDANRSPSRARECLVHRRPLPFRHRPRSAAYVDCGGGYASRLGKEPLRPGCTTW